MKLKTFLLTSIFAASAGISHAALSLPTMNTAVNIDFTGFEAPATWASATPAANQLDSSIWAYNDTGARTSTAATFGGNVTGGLGESAGGVSTGGVYAFDVGGGTIALGVQPTGSIWTPGSFTARLQNNTGSTMTSLAIDWTVWVINDQARDNQFRLYYSGDNATYTHAGAAVEVVSPTAADATPAWVATNRTFTVTGLNVANGENYFIRWGGDDVTGSGNRDEFGISGISFTPIPEPSAALLGAIGMLALLRRRR